MTEADEWTNKNKIVMFVMIVAVAFAFTGSMAMLQKIQDMGGTFTREETVTTIDLYQSGRLLSEDRTLLQFEDGGSMVLDDHHPEIRVGETYIIQYKAHPYMDESKIPEGKACELLDLTLTGRGG